MNRLIVIVLVALGLSVVLAPTAAPASGSDAQGPPCSNITNGDGRYTGTVGSAGSVDFTVGMWQSTHVDVFGG